MDDFINEEKDRRKQIRNLHQYKELSDEEFERVYQSIINKDLKNPYFEKRIKEEIAKFEKDYEISDLKINDMNTLRALIQAMLALEDYEQLAYKLQKKTVIDEEADYIIARLEKINKIMNSLRTDISRMQEDLKITRKIRKSDREESVINAIQDIKDRAKNFYTQKFARVFCPECKMLLGSVWVMYPESHNNKFWFYCKRCEQRIMISFPELVKSGMRNIKDVPEF